MQRIITIERFIIEREHEIPGATGEFSKLLTDIALAAKIVWREVSKAGLVDIIGSTGKVNISGDVVQKLGKKLHNKKLTLYWHLYTSHLSGQIS